MTPEQFDCWKDFSVRMAKTCFRSHRRPNAQWILEQVESYFWDLGRDSDEVFTIKDWDHAGPYEDGRRMYHLSYCGCDGRRKDRPLADCVECRGTGLHHAFQTGSYVCDNVSEMLDGAMPRSPQCKACDHKNCRTGWPHYEDRCPTCELECKCDEVDQLYGEQWDDQWGGPVRCCIRAGLDVAVSPSAGVCGFTAGDIRRMYPEGVPDWVQEFFQPGEVIALHATSIAGIYAPETKGWDTRTFAELPDNQGVWL